MRPTHAVGQKLRLGRSIILEGPDGTGKTTLGKKLAEDFGIPYYYAGGPPDRTDEAIAAKCQENIDRTTFVCVQDRVSLISEMCYRGVMDPEFVAQSAVLVSAFLAKALENRPILIFCLADDGLERATTEDFEADDFTKQLHKFFPAITAEYHKVFGLIAAGYRGVLRYDFRQTSYEDLTHQIQLMDMRDMI